MYKLKNIKKADFFTAAPPRKLFLKIKQVRAARREEIVDFFMQNRSKIAIFDGKNLYSGVKSWGGGRCPPQKFVGGVATIVCYNFGYLRITAPTVHGGD